VALLTLQERQSVLQKIIPKKRFLLNIQNIPKGSSTNLKRLVLVHVRESPKKRLFHLILQEKNPFEFIPSSEEKIPKKMSMTSLFSMQKRQDFHF
jgi:hypothetical protein